MKKKLSWTAYSNSDRHQLIEEIKTAISKHDGCIMNFNMFSDLAMSLSIEIEENKIPKLQSELSDVVDLVDESPNDIDLDSKKEWLIFINVSFGKGRGALKNEVPEVPG